jgi:hypothetical protein
VSNELFIIASTVFFAALLGWGFMVLPNEKWQFLAAVPHRQLFNGKWEGINLTYYGVFNALAHIVAVSFLLILTAAVGISTGKILTILVILMAICLPSSRLLAKMIEKKAHTFTVGGASFVGIVLAPAVVWLVYCIGYPESAIPFLPILAAMSIAYAIGEGMGRLACISYGCCYGKPLDACPPVFQRVFQNLAFVFRGTTKKIAYEGGMEQRKVFPIQAVTSIILIGTALAGIYLFLHGRYSAAFVFTVFITQAWRFISEIFRADYRGGGVLSVYQILSILAVVFPLVLCLFLPRSAMMADIRTGIKSLWHPGLILLLQAWAAGIFLYTGRSRVTGSHLAFYVNKECV